MKDMQWPIISMEAIYHVGTLNPEDKRNNSHEGDGLSISTHPRAWTRINPYTSGDTFECTKENNHFLDKHALTNEQIDAIIAWGIEEGWVESCVYYRMTAFDCEWEEEYWMHFRTEEEANSEAEEEGSVSVVSDGFQMTPKMQQKMMTSEQELEPFCKLVVLFSEYYLSIDGVWWNDILAVHSYSAPRGVIVPSKLKDWTFNVTAEH